LGKHFPNKQQTLLRAPVSDDLIWMAGIELNPLNKKFSSLHEQLCLNDLEEFINNLPVLLHDKQCRLVCEFNTVPVGLIDLYDADLQQQSAWVGIILDEAFRQKGLGLIYLNLLEQYAVQYGLLNLFAMVHPLNFPALSLFRKAGYRPFQQAQTDGMVHLIKQLCETLPLHQ